LFDVEICVVLAVVKWVTDEDEDEACCFLAKLPVFGLRRLVIIVLGVALSVDLIMVASFSV